MTAAPGLGLVGDIGATNARFALVEGDGSRRRLLALEHLVCADFPTFEASLTHYLAGVGAAPRRGVVAVAGPVRDNGARFTNLGWHVTRQSLASAGFADLRLINDFAAQALALPLLGADRLFVLGPLAQAVDGTLAVLGPGSGLGVAALVRGAAGHDLPLATEGGHADFAATDAVEIEILSILSRDGGRVSLERLLSGEGLSRLHAVLQQIDGQSGPALSAADVSARGLAGDGPCRATLLRFCAMLGGAAGSIALTLGASGGVFIAGGIMPRLLPILAASAFRARFEAKPPMVDWLRAVPTLVITDSNSALLGAARLLDSAA